MNSSLDTLYHFSDFTEKNYVKLLKLTKKNYDFELFSTKSKNPHVLWRHDVDFSIHRALSLAKIEHSLDVKSTYFIRLHSEFYNILEKPIFEKINEIHNLGHDIGLHFESNFYDIKSRSELERKLKFETKLFKSLFLFDIKSFSFHNPEEGDVLKINDDKIANLINCYSKKFKNNYHYCSDSMGYWRFERLENLLNKNEYSKLQILIHPEWWQQKSMSPKKRFQRCLDIRLKRNKESWINTIKHHKRMNKVWSGNW